MSTLYEGLKKYSQSDYYPFHMPGGKRNEKLAETGLPYQYDITEIEGFDDLHHSTGLIRDLEKRGSKVYGSEETALLVNGSTSGILAGIMATSNKGDKILVGRNSHKSIYHGIFLNELEAVYLYPQYDEKWDLLLDISPLSVKQAIEENPNIKAVVLTSPTFEGVVSDIEEIAKILHKRNIPLIVDEAHGAHFGFSQKFPKSSNKLGADLVINSVHKTLPALTQTALIHKNGNLVDWQKVKFYLQILQSSSPSYILMSSIDVCISILEDEKTRKKWFDDYEEILETARKRLGKLSSLKLVEKENIEPSKILISGKGAGKTGLDLYNVLLEKYHLQMEMATGSTVLAMTSIADSKEGLERLVNALEEMDKDKSVNNETFIEKDKRNVDKESIDEKTWKFPKLKQAYKISEALSKAEKKKKSLPFKDCSGYISKEFVYLYPPGIPLIVPGEVICSEAVEILLQYEGLGYKIKGIKTPSEIEVIDK